MQACLKTLSSVRVVGSGSLVKADGVGRQSAVGVGFHGERMKSIRQY